jgi:phosphoserine phosphatase RsbU/P
LVLAGLLTPCFVARGLLVPRLVCPLPPQRQASAQFRLDFGLFLLAGAGMSLFNLWYYGFPLLGSGSKLALGVTTVGLFASVDLALERERGQISRAIEMGVKGMRPPEHLYPMTRTFSIIATAVLLLVSLIVSLLFWRDLVWLSKAVQDTGALIEALKTEVFVEIAFVMGLLLALCINLILSYSRNLKLLFTNQTRVLAQVSRGELDGSVPVMTEDEFGFIAGHTNTMIEGLRDRLRMQQGLSVARDVQRNLLPSAPPRVAGLEMAGSSVYSDETGGDYYDFFEHCGPACDLDGKGLDVGVAVGDVSGHGVGPALLMATARAMFRLRMSQGGGLGECVGDVNRHLAKDLYGSGRFMTLYALLLGSEGRGLTVVSAGHDPAMVYDPEADVFQEYGSGGLPLGVEEEWVYDAAEYPPLKQGQVLCIGTDGIWEARDASGEMYGKERLRDVLRGNARKKAQAILDAVLADVTAFRGGMRQDDDITLVIVKAVP